MTRLILLIVLPGLLSTAKASDAYATAGNVPPRIEKLTPEKEAEILKDVKVADGFDVTVFASPPAVNYPVFVAAAPDGTLYVSSDGNGSLGRNPHRGRIIRLRDLDGDGRADETKVFCEVDAPRGLVWDHDRLYLLHPPDLSVYIDKDGDGIADEEKVLVKGIAFGYDQRPADHTTNGLSLGIDGWLYIAGGDFGFMDAVGTDGRHLQHRGGGVIRVRPDGTGLEIYSTGTRNILEVAISPLMDIFARDNTNDGGGWNVRFHHFTGLDDHGYPRLFKNFPDECIAPLADYGGGSGCGAVYIDEPGFGKWNNAPFTCDWGTGALYHHTVKPKGATFEETEPPQPFIKMTRPTDADVDAMSRVYCASWKEATFNWEGPNVGYIVCVKPKGWRMPQSSHQAPRDEPGTSRSATAVSTPSSQLVSRSETSTFPEPLPDFHKASDAELVKLLESTSNRRRMEAQSELGRRKLSADLVNLVVDLLRSDKASLSSRIAALYAIAIGNWTLSSKELDQRLVEKLQLKRFRDRIPSRNLLLSAGSDGSLMAHVARAMMFSPDSIFKERQPKMIWYEDDTALLSEVFFSASNARAQLEAFHAASAGFYPPSLLLDRIKEEPEPVLQHAMIRALSSALSLGKPKIGIRGSDYAHTLDHPDLLTSMLSLLGLKLEAGVSYRQRIVLQALAKTHDPEAVAGLITRLSTTTDPALRRGILSALCRLHFKEGEWKGDSWGTRPDTTGPYYQPEPWSETPRIAAALKDALTNASSEEAAFLVNEMTRNRIQSDDALNTVLAMAAKDAKLLPAAVGQLAKADVIPAAGVPLLIQAANDPSATDAMLAETVIALAKSDSADGLKAALSTLPRLSRTRTENRAYANARDAFLSAPKLENHHQLLEDIAAEMNGDVSIWGDACLLNLAARKSGSPESREMSAKALDEGWKNPKRRIQMLAAMRVSENKSWADKVLAATEDADKELSKAAQGTAKALRLEKRKTVKDDTPLLATLKLEEIVAAVMKTHGDVRRGEELFTQQTCIACHTTAMDQPQKGPYLGNIAQTYKRKELAENILNPNKTIAQGFQTNLFTLKDGTQQMGFVVQESADKVTVRNIAAQELTYAVKDIAKRERIEPSLMPPGLVLNITLRDFASLLDYLEALSRK